jgi:tetratricopeptide (TPR) repeat protein
MSQQSKNQNRRIRSRRGLRKLTLLVLTGILAATGLAIVFWWQEQALRQATLYLEDGDPNKALFTVDAFLREHPEHSEAMSLRARILVAVGQPRQAIDLFARFGVTNSKETHALAQALLQLERWREALPLLEHLEGTDVDRVDVLHELAACRAELGDLQGAIAAAREFAQQPGMAARGNLLLGTLYNRQGDLRQAATVWGDVLNDSPTAEGLQIPAAEFLLNYGRVLSASGNFRLAAELIDRSLKLTPSAEGFIEMGNARLDLGERVAAEKSYKQALELEPGIPAARVGLAQLALADGDAARAKELLSVLASPDKLTSEVAVLLQQATTRLGEVEAATQWREKADKLRLVEQAGEVLKDFPSTK